MKWVIMFFASVLLLTGCQPSIDKSDEGDVWEVEFRAEQPSENEEAAIYTFHYLPDNPEEVEEINYVTDTGIEVNGASLEGDTMFTDENMCTGCSVTQEETTIEVDINWTTDQGEEHKESLTLD